MTKTFKNFLPLILCFFLIGYLRLDGYTTTVKELTDLAGVKENFFIGYGLVTGLAGTGDRRSRLTQKSLSRLMATNGIEIEDRLLTTRNTAAVIITTSASGFLEKGDKVDVIVASVGDARSLANGVLLPTPLKAGNGTIYIVAGGLLTSSSTDTILTRSIIPQGGIVERDFATSSDTTTSGSAPLLLYDQQTLTLKLKGFHIETASLIKTTIEETFPDVTVTFNGDKTLVMTTAAAEPLPHTLVYSILNTEIEIPAPRIVVIDEAAGTVIVGGDVTLDPSFISLPIPANDPSRFSSLSPFATFNGTNGTPAPLLYATVEELLNELRSLGLNGYQIGSIFRALDKSNSINAEVIFQ